MMTEFQDYFDWYTSYQGRADSLFTHAYRNSVNRGDLQARRRNEKKQKRKESYKQ